VRTTATICSAPIPVADASTIIARYRLDWYVARFEIDSNRAPSSNDNSRTNTSGGRITTSRLRDIHPHTPPRPRFRSNVYGDPLTHLVFPQEVAKPIRASDVVHATARGVVAAMSMTGMRAVTGGLDVVDQTPPQAMLRQIIPGLIK